MIKAVANVGDRSLVVLGLSFRNLDRFREQPGDTFIKIDGNELGLPVDIIIFSGETEAHMAVAMQEFIGPGTKVNIDPKLRS